MATYSSNAVSNQLGQHAHAYQRVSPLLYFVVQGTLKSDHTTSQTWVSRGVADLKATTHEGCRVLGQFYVE
jgi:hypothetical protein